MFYLNLKIAFSISWKSVLKSIQLSVTNTMLSFVSVAEKNLLILPSSVLLHTVRKMCMVSPHISLHWLFD